MILQSGCLDKHGFIVDNRRVNFDFIV